MTINPNKCPGCEAEKSIEIDFADRSLACMEAWIKAEYPSALVIQGQMLQELKFDEGEQPYVAKVYDVNRMDFFGTAATPLLALQSVISQIIKWRSR